MIVKNRNTPRDVAFWDHVEAVSDHVRRRAAMGEVTVTMQPKWVCFHCDFATSSEAEASAHFGDRDDAGEFTPLCKWWSNMDDQERKEQFQSLIAELNGEREQSAQNDDAHQLAHAALQAENERLKGEIAEVRRLALEEAAKAATAAVSGTTFHSGNSAGVQAIFAALVALAAPAQPAKEGNV